MQTRSEYRGLSTQITLLRIPYLGRIGSTKLVLPKWHKYSILNRVIRVLCKRGLDGDNHYLKFLFDFRKRKLYIF